MRFLLPAAILGVLVAVPGQGGDKKQNPEVILDTSFGRVVIELYEDKAPITAKNFLKYVDEKHFDGTVFHRVIADFMVQGGGFEAGLKREKKTHAPIKNESSNGISNERGTIAMARTNDPDSATAQFFINVVDNPFLDKKNAKGKEGYAVFGKVTQGMDVVDKIRRVPTDSDDRPDQDVVIRSIRRRN